MDILIKMKDGSIHESTDTYLNDILLNKPVYHNDLSGYQYIMMFKYKGYWIETIEITADKIVYMMFK